MNTVPEFLSREAASAYLREKWGVSFSARTLANLHVKGHGPPVRYFGRKPMHAPDGLDVWVLSRLGPIVHSTSEAQTLAEAS